MKLTLEQKIYIRNNYYKLCPIEMANALGIREYVVYQFCAINGLLSGRHKTTIEVKRETKKVFDGRRIYEDRVVQIQRPKAVYSNSPSPFGIADELFNRNLTKQCYAENKIIG